MQIRLQFDIRAIGRLPRSVWTYARLPPVTWFEAGTLAACQFPRTDAAVGELAAAGVRSIVNLHERAHPSARLARYGVSELHLPVADFSAPTQAQLELGVEAIEGALGAGTRVAVHCGAGLGRTGTLIACYRVRRGLTAEAAIAEVRARRPGSIETAAQEAAVRTFARLNY